MLAVHEDKRCEVMGILPQPTESALGCSKMLVELQERDVRGIVQVCADGLKCLEVISAFPLAQRTWNAICWAACVTETSEDRLRICGRYSAQEIAVIRYRHSVRNGARIITIFNDGAKIRSTRPSSPIWTTRYGFSRWSTRQTGSNGSRKIFGELQEPCPNEESVLLWVGKQSWIRNRIWGLSLGPT